MFLFLGIDRKLFNESLGARRVARHWVRLFGEIYADTS